jgi:hypothetical protein
MKFYTDTAVSLDLQYRMFRKIELHTVVNAFIDLPPVSIL